MAPLTHENTYLFLERFLLTWHDMHFTAPEENLKSTDGHRVDIISWVNFFVVKSSYPLRIRFLH